MGDGKREGGASDTALLDTICVLTWFLQGEVRDSFLGDSLRIFLPRNVFLDLPLQVLAGSQCVNVPSLFFSAKQVNLNHVEQGDMLTCSPTLP